MAEQLSRTMTRGRQVALPKKEPVRIYNWHGIALNMVLLTVILSIPWVVV